MTDGKQSPGHRAVYWSHVKGILLPGEDVLQFASYEQDMGDMHGWENADLEIVLDVGKAQLARQNANLEAIRGRAQFLLTVTLAFIGVAIASTEFVSKSVFAQLIWGAGIAVAFASVLGAGGVIVARKSLRMVDTRLLTQQRAPILAATASAFAESVADGENTVATEITVFRDAVALFLLSFVFVCVAWVIAAAS